MRTTAGAFTDLFPPDHRLKLGQGVVGWVGLYGEKVVANDVDVEPHYVNLYPDLIPTQSELSVPIRVGNEIVGVLDVQSPQFNAFDQNDVMAMETLADQIAVAIKNAWLFEESQRQVQELAGLYDTALATSSALEIEVLLSHLYNQVQQLMAPDTLVVVLHDAEAEGYRVALAVEEGETVPGAVGMRVALKEGGLTGWVIRERESLLVGDLEVDPLPVEPRHGARPARAWLEPKRPAHRNGKSRRAKVRRRKRQEAGLVSPPSPPDAPRNTLRCSVQGSIFPRPKSTRDNGPPPRGAGAPHTRQPSAISHQLSMARLTIVSAQRSACFRSKQASSSSGVKWAPTSASLPRSERNAPSPWNAFIALRCTIS